MNLFIKWEFSVSKLSINSIESQLFPHSPLQLRHFIERIKCWRYPDNYRHLRFQINQPVKQGAFYLMCLMTDVNQKTVLNLLSDAASGGPHIQIPASLISVMLSWSKIAGFLIDQCTILKHLIDSRRFQPVSSILQILQ